MSNTKITNSPYREASVIVQAQLFSWLDTMNTAKNEGDRLTQAIARDAIREKRERLAAIRYASSTGDLPC